jgi:hypothetical protein
MTDLSWSLFKIWNDSIEKGRDPKPVQPRDHLWASELGGSMVDIYLKLKGTTPSNPPNARSNRKFEAGNMMEWVVGMVLTRAGILIESQKWVKYQYPGLLAVTGKIDHLAGGNPDWERAEKTLDDLQLPEFFGRGTRAIINHLKAEFPGGIPVTPFEVKSCSNFMFEKYLNGGINEGHQLQLFHYEKSEGYDEGHLNYINRDDMRMVEQAVMNPSPIEEVYKNKIETITNYYNSNERPPIEAELIFENGKVSTNWKIEYSGFLKMLYGYDEPENYRERWKSDVGGFNRALGRIARGEKITPNNREKIAKMSALIPELADMDKLSDDEIYTLGKTWKNVEPETEENE